VALLSGGTGGAKLARGLLDELEPGELSVIANTGDDIEVYGVHVSPDPDLVAYWLADVIDERGYGIRGDTWEVMAALEDAGRDTWFRLGDRDLAMCLIRTDLLQSGERLTQAHAAVVGALGVSAEVLPMSDDPVRTRIDSGGRLLPFQEFMILGRGTGPVDGVEFSGADSAAPSPEVLEAIARADAIVIGPSNPIASIGPVLALSGMREALREAPAPVVAVSPFVGGRVLKGPTEVFCEHAGIELSAQGIADHYGDLLDGLVADEPAEGPELRELDTDMGDRWGRRRVAEAVVELAGDLAGG
jgi:LPPG:FO 2-phospho-L-lactate transferase